MFIQIPLQSHNEPNTPEDARKHFLVNRLIHFALVVGVVMFGGIAVLISAKDIFSIPFSTNSIFKIPAFVCIFTIGLSFVVAPFYRKVTPAPTSPRSALQQYQIMCLIRWAVIEAGGFFAGIAIILTKEIASIGFFVISVAYLICRYPSQKEFIAFTGDKKG
ncbi:MAG: hypothetical protein A2283_03825 [Lentisphaerae bacterium RIFOXYA12_FULL_48_11]|nr:MAG: hypothetical protein A2283_03825 [Lentisphaerae bacterium RIFOXYA12_FULL_48_11]